MERVFRLNEPQVACESLEGDLLLLNFESGFYYNIRGVGADICQYLLAGGILDPAVTAAVRHFELPLEQIAREVGVFVDELLAHRLIVPVEATAHPNNDCQFTATSYAPPRCEKFDDLADQLLLDKIDDPHRDAQWTQTV